MHEVWMGPRALLKVAAALCVIGAAFVIAMPAGAAGPSGGSSGNDTCGYPASSFTESTVMRGAEIVDTGTGPRLVAFANDEKGLLLGSGASTTANTSAPQHVANPNLGDPSATDQSKRPYFPVLYVTDVTSNASSQAGDFQQGGTPANLSGGAPFVNDVYGTWSTATGSVSANNYAVTPPAGKNNWNLGSGADAPMDTSFNQGYGAELSWNVSQLGLQPGNTYRIQVIEHDGDQNKTGGDAGEYCVTLKIPGSPPPPPPSSPHPAIKLVKLERDGSSGAYQPGPITVKVGDTIEYQMTVDNTGDTTLVIDFSDPVCDGTLSAPTVTAGSYDSGSRTLSVGGELQYTCSHVLTSSDPSPFVNTATATGTPPSGQPVSAQSSVVANKQALQAKKVKKPKKCPPGTIKKIKHKNGKKIVVCKAKKISHPPRHVRGFTGSAHQ